MKSLLSGHFIPSLRGNVFLLLRRPARALRSSSCVLVVPPFGEELNKSRKLITEFSCRLTDAGMAAAIIDLYGTGDSQGTLERTDWTTWRADVGTAVNWLAEEGLTITGCLAIRLGCVLVAECAQQLGLRLRSSVFLQPVTNGKQMVDETLRLRTVSALLDGDRRETVRELRLLLSDGKVIEAGGYRLSPRLVSSLDNVCLANVDPVSMGRIIWVEIRRSKASPSWHESKRQIRKLESRGACVTPVQMDGEPFWMAAEPVADPELVELSANACIQTN